MTDEVKSRNATTADPSSDEPGERSYVRIDLEIRVLKMDETTREVLFEAWPDPRRYDEGMKDGKKIWIDKYTGDAFGEELWKASAPQFEGMPLSHLPRYIDNSDTYAASRQRALEVEMVTGRHTPPSEMLPPHTPLATTPQERSMTFLSVDICGSSVMRANDGEGYARCFEVFFREMAIVAAQFSGSVFKATGDGLIAYLDTESVNTQCDAAIDMGLTFLKVLQEAVNPALTHAGLPPIRIRVGAEHGSAKVTFLSVPSINYSKSDISSDALNRAVKIEGTCTADSFRIGEALYRRIHVQWLERSRLCVEDISKDVGISSYQIYEVS